VDLIWGEFFLPESFAGVGVDVDKFASEVGGVDTVVDEDG